MLEKSIDFFYYFNSEEKGFLYLLFVYSFSRYQIKRVTSDSGDANTHRTPQIYNYAQNTPSTIIISRKLGRHFM